MQADLTDNITILIRNRNEAQYIGFALQSCIDHFNKPEIIIIDNNSTDDSLEIVNLFIDRTDIKVLNINEYTPGKSINLGVRNAMRDTILILSAHSQITNVNLNNVEKLLLNYKAVMGQQNPIYRGKKISKRYIWSHFGDDPIINMYSDIENRHFLHNAFCFYKKKDLIEYPMPENFPGKEDRFWAADIVKLGYSYIYDPTLQCNHFYTTHGSTWKGIG